MKTYHGIMLKYNSEIWEEIYSLFVFFFSSVSWNNDLEVHQSFLVHQWLSFFPLLSLIITYDSTTVYKQDTSYFPHQDALFFLPQHYFSHSSSYPNKIKLLEYFHFPTFLHSVTPILKVFWNGTVPRVFLEVRPFCFKNTYSTIMSHSSRQPILIMNTDTDTHIPLHSSFCSGSFIDI